jgi:hypothetical protein
MSASALILARQGLPLPSACSDGRFKCYQLAVADVEWMASLGNGAIADVLRGAYGDFPQESRTNILLISKMVCVSTRDGKALRRSPLAHNNNS